MAKADISNLIIPLTVAGAVFYLLPSVKGGVSSAFGSTGEAISDTAGGIGRITSSVGEAGGSFFDVFDTSFDFLNQSIKGLQNNFRDQDQINKEIFNRIVEQSDRETRLRLENNQKAIDQARQTEEGRAVLQVQGDITQARGKAISQLISDLSEGRITSDQFDSKLFITKNTSDVNKLESIRRSSSSGGSSARIPTAKDFKSAISTKSSTGIVKIKDKGAIDIKNKQSITNKEAEKRNKIRNSKLGKALGL